MESGGAGYGHRRDGWPRRWQKQRHDAGSAAALSPDRLALILWLGFVVASLFLHRDAIANLAFSDPDNAMRLAQVRDLVGGQNWFDTAQYRTNPGGGGGPTHWSRFIDAPIVVLIDLFQPVRRSANRRALGAGDLSAAAGAAVAARLFPDIADFGRPAVRLHRPRDRGDDDQLSPSFRPAQYRSSQLAGVALGHLLLWLRAARRRASRTDYGRRSRRASMSRFRWKDFPSTGLFWALFVFDWLRDPAKASRLRGFSAGMILLPALWSLPFRGAAYLSTVFATASPCPICLPPPRPGRCS